MIWLIVAYSAVATLVFARLIKSEPSVGALTVALDLVAAAVWPVTTFFVFWLYCRDHA